MYILKCIAAVLQFCELLFAKHVPWAGAQYDVPPQIKSFPIERTQGGGGGRGGGGGGGGGESGGKVFGFVPHSLLSPKEKKKKKMPGEVWHQRKSVVGRGHSEGFFWRQKKDNFSWTQVLSKRHTTRRFKACIIRQLALQE